MVEDSAIRNAWRRPVDGRRQCYKGMHGGDRWMVEDSAIRNAWRRPVDGRKQCYKECMEARLS